MHFDFYRAPFVLTVLGHYKSLSVYKSINITQRKYPDSLDSVPTGCTIHVQSMYSYRLWQVQSKFFVRPARSAMLFTQSFLGVFSSV